MTKAELTAYVGEHENEYVQQYVEAVYDELEELGNLSDTIVRYGYTDEGRETVRKFGRMLLLGALIAIAFIVGRLSN
jgi:hypothetical protein